MRVGWIGLGRMGRPMVENLVRKGFDVTVQNRGQGKVQELASMGAKAGGTFAEMGGSVDSLHTCLPNGEAVSEVLTGPGGVLMGARAGLIIVDHSTIHPDIARRLAGMCSERGVGFLDAPVSGAGPVAERGELTIMVGGDRSAFDRVKPALEAMGRTVEHMGANGAGASTKLVNNMLMETNLAVAFEALALGYRAGLDLTALFNVIRTASGASRAWERNVPRVLKREFPRDGSISSGTKDADIVHRMAETFGLQTPVFNAAWAFWHAALDAGLGDEDLSKAVRIVEAREGFEMRGADGM